jgi:cytochrome oxidase assembly protein ShyY1
VTRRIPVLPTLLVALAAAVMVWLGIWQLHRLKWKEGLLAEYAAAAHKPPVAFPLDLTDQSLLFRKSEAFCLEPVGWRASSGRNDAGQPGWRHVADCRTGAEGPGLAVDMGWSKQSTAPAWKGGEVKGVIGPDHDNQILLVSDAAGPGLWPSQPPSLDDIPNNHLAYAVQWFIFAALAVGIYGIALWRRGKAERVREEAPPKL